VSGLHPNPNPNLNPNLNLDGLAKSLQSVMPDLIRHPETIEKPGFRVNRLGHNHFNHKCGVPVLPVIFRTPADESMPSAESFSSN
jgi:hypothetical protein